LTWKGDATFYGMRAKRSDNNNNEKGRNISGAEEL
jgi:hypothetical protein